MDSVATSGSINASRLETGPAKWEVRSEEYRTQDRLRHCGWKSELEGSRSGEQKITQIVVGSATAWAHQCSTWKTFQVKIHKFAHSVHCTVELQDSSIHMPDKRKRLAVCSLWQFIVIIFMSDDLKFKSDLIGSFFFFRRSPKCQEMTDIILFFYNWFTFAMKPSENL